VPFGQLHNQRPHISQTNEKISLLFQCKHSYFQNSNEEISKIPNKANKKQEVFRIEEFLF